MHEKQQKTVLKTFYPIYNGLTDATVRVKRNSLLRGVERQAVAYLPYGGKKE